LFILNLIITLKNLLSLNSTFILYMNTIFSKKDTFSHNTMICIFFASPQIPSQFETKIILIKTAI
jgi:hypothetical protein